MSFAGSLSRRGIYDRIFESAWEVVEDDDLVAHVLQNKIHVGADLARSALH